MLTTVLETLIPRIALLAALVVTPWCLARACRPRADWLSTGALAGVFAIVLAAVPPLLMHVGEVPILPSTLSALHLFFLCLALVARGVSRAPWRPAGTIPRPALLTLLLFAVLVLPCTRLAGIDTYKWQGLATNVRVEESVPWVIHPISLLGFTPRAYPPLQPLLLATAEILGGFGIEFGFYLVSLVSGFTAVCVTGLFARRYFDIARHADWFTFFYVLSPVFMRYNHWATGRGLFLALLPALLLCLLEFPRWRALLALPCACLLVALTHKVGLVAVAVLLPVTLCSVLLPRWGSRLVPLLAALPFVALAVCLAPSSLLPGPAGHLAGFARMAVTRFGWMLPVAALALAGPRGWLVHPRRRRLLPAMLVTLPLAFPSDIYGALLALPFVTLAATAGLAWLCDRLPVLSRPLSTGAIAVTVLGALLIVGQRTLAATPPRVWRAAQFLERLDPRGPYQIFAPGRARAQMHAYVSGCPRFVLTPGAAAQATRRPLPPLRGDPAQVVRQWIDFGRNFMELSDVAVDWYGVNPRAYYVVQDGNGERPPYGELLYDRDDIQIFQPSGQYVPAGEAH